VRERLLKQRWRHVSGETCHSRPPDDLASLHFCSLVVVLTLATWLSSDAGVHAHEPPAALTERPAPRTLQRWQARALALSLSSSTEQHLRAAVLERGEPRPMKKLFPSGLSPPGEDDHRRWRDAPGLASVQKYGAPKKGTVVNSVFCSGSSAAPEFTNAQEECRRSDSIGDR